MGEKAPPTGCCVALSHASISGPQLLAKFNKGVNTVVSKAEIPKCEAVYFWGMQDNAIRYTDKIALNTLYSKSQAFLVARMVKNPLAMGDRILIPWIRKIPWKMAAHSVILPGNPIDKEAWWATAHRVAESQIRLSDSTTHSNHSRRKRSDARVS